MVGRLIWQASGYVFDWFPSPLLTRRIFPGLAIPKGIGLGEGTVPRVMDRDGASRIGRPRFATFPFLFSYTRSLRLLPSRVYLGSKPKASLRTLEESSAGEDRNGSFQRLFEHSIGIMYCLVFTLDGVGLEPGREKSQAQSALRAHSELNGDSQRDYSGIHEPVMAM